MPSLSRSRVRDLVKAIELSLAGLAKAEGLEISSGGARFDDNNLRLTLNIAVLADDGTALTREHTDWTQLARFFGLEPDWLGQEFTYLTNTYRITGLNRRAKRMPVMAEQVPSGKAYKFPVDLVKYAFTGR